jgi:AcrR family transcriptional regulator
VCRERGVGAVTDDDWRSRKKAATRRSIQEHALRLFAANGYDNTTVEDIAAAAGVSHMTFFRYFPRKENVVETREYDPMIEELIVARPPDESPIAAIGAALSTWVAAVLLTDRQRILTRVRLMMATPDLRARQIITMDDTRDLFARSLARRNRQAQENLVVTVHAAVAVAVFVTALRTWAQTDDGDLVAIVDAAFSAAETATTPQPPDSATSHIIRSPQPARAAEHRRRNM